MTAGPRDEVPPDGILTRDWITLVHSELAALAVDREAQELLHALLKIWAGASGVMLAGLARADDRAGGRPSADAAPRAAPAAAASGAGEHEVERLVERIGRLEARIDELEHAAGGTDRTRGRKPGSRVRRTRPADKTTG